MWQATLTRFCESPVGSVQKLVGHAEHNFKSAREFAPEFQVVLPYRGITVGHVGGDDIVCDATRCYA